MNSQAFAMSVAPTWLWVGFSLALVFLLVVDLLLFSKVHGERRRTLSLIESVFWIFLALGFNLWFAKNYGAELGLEFFTAYLVEKSLSVDNLFIILLIFTSFRIPLSLQHRVLFYGVFGAVVMRCTFILVGMRMLQSFHWILYIFGVFLIYTSIKLLFEKSHAQAQEHEGRLAQYLKKILPTTQNFDGQKFFIRESGRLKATPLFLALIVVEASDLFFAIDSIPAVFAVTQDAFVAFASNSLAILGLRALYFVLAHWVVRLRYLKPGLAMILAFIGLKLLLIDWVHVPALFSLAVIFTFLGGAIAASIWKGSGSLQKK